MMDSAIANNPITESEGTSIPLPNKSFCQRSDSENGGFVSVLRTHFHEFVHSSMDDHKTCLRTIFHKAYGRLKNLGGNSLSANEVASSLPLSNTPDGKGSLPGINYWIKVGDPF
ncbi:hypothetical protein JCGZ_25647 [Jatropha curcas]|uniref:Uncharacterized protein n=1 Tax=Jatropha curcas TaxID=180498 RepID=A0A067JK42_JATCU|nr:hypothetical protein JCGZ_25647 [Jatropha curcas]